MTDGNGTDNKRFMEMRQDAWMLHVLISTLKLRYSQLQKMMANTDTLIPQTAHEPAGIFTATLPLLNAIEYLLLRWIGNYRPSTSHFRASGGLEGFVDDMNNTFEAYEKFEKLLQEEAEK